MKGAWASTSDSWDVDRSSSENGGKTRCLEGLLSEFYKMWAEDLAQTSLSMNGPCSMITSSLSSIIMITGRIKTSQ